MRDIEYDPTEESLYECFDCGRVVTAETAPGRCGECGGPLRNRQTPLE